MTPQKYPRNLHTPKKIQFSEPPPPPKKKYIEIQNFEPQKYPPGGKRTDRPKAKMKNLPSSQI